MKQKITIGDTAPKKKKITVISNSEITIQEVIEKFIREKLAYGNTEAYMQTIRSHLRVFTKFIGEDKPCSKITSKDVDDYVVHLTNDYNKNLRPKSKQSYVKHLRVILYYAMEHDYVEEFKIKLPSAPDTGKDPYTDKELEKLLEAPSKKNTKGKITFRHYRNWAMVWWFLSLSTRRRTAKEAKIRHVNFEEEMIKIEDTKNGETLYLPLEPDLKDVLLTYLAMRQGEPDDYLFCSQYGEQLSSSYITHSIAQYNRSRGVDRTSIHIFRHTFAKNYLLSGGDMFTLKRILGHKSLEMVENYIKLYNVDIRNNFQNLSLVARVKRNSQQKPRIKP